jgi:hypothetical protein
MRISILRAIISVPVAVGLMAAAPTPLAAQAQTPKAAASPTKNSKASRTAWGDPDLQGQWNSQTSTPLERPRDGVLAEKSELSDEEAETFERTNRASFDAPPRAGDPGTYNAFWRDYGKALKRTSLIVDPEDGRIPALTPEAQKRLAAERAERAKRGPSDSPDTYEDLSAWTRCISRGWNGIGSWYSSNYQIFQTPGYVVVLQELIHEARIIPLDGRPHISTDIPQWMGDSRGHWEGDTLVVDTTNFDRRTSYQGSRETLHLIERYTRVGSDTLDYQFTIDDPKTFTKPWTVARPARRVTDGVSIFEYGCHEGNLAMTGILAGARAAERAAKEKATQGQ